MIKIFKKLLYIKEEQKNSLDEIQKKIELNGGRVSTMRLMQDSIQIFLDHYQNEAIEKYSPFYEVKNELK